jgi:transcriptional regulator with GAF, ATPase, and Fis domain
VPLSDHHQALLTTAWEFQIFDDLQSDPVERKEPPGQAGYRALLRIPIRVQGALAGVIDFASLTPGLYTSADVLVARRIADHVALALSHQRLAQEAQRTAEARAQARALEDRVKSLADELRAVTGYRRVVGQSESWKKVLKQATQVAATETTVLLLGESGTGKEVVARFIHRASARSGGPFVALNCAALPEPLLESELFGFERGAFTGAQQAKPGQLEQAAGGLLFLDEVAEMSPSAQAKFLRVLEEREFQRLGSTRTLKANVRIVAATNRDLRAAMERGAFREDLYYRLHVFEIHLPPLRERKDDILPLSDAFLEEIAKAFGRPPAGISREARDGLVAYRWPGNVRELRNMLERAAILCEGGLITAEHLTFLPPSSKEGGSIAGGDGPKARSSEADTTDLRVIERATIERALQTARFNKSQAAKLLGLSRRQLYVRMRQHGLQ